jgi:hypothetical protein
MLHFFSTIDNDVSKTMNPKIRLQVSSKPYSAFPQSAKDEIHLVSYRKDKLPDIVGSFAYRIQKYPADIDVMEDVDSYEIQGRWAPATNPNQIIQGFSRVIKQIMQNIKATPDHYVLDFKAGADDRYLFNMGTMTNGILTLAPDFPQQVMHRAQVGLYTPEEYKKIVAIYDMPRPLTADQYDLLTKLLRAHYPLRWTADEIIQGRKTLPLGKVVTLEQALTMFQLVKMDLAAQVNGKYMEVSNIWTLFYHSTAQTDANGIGEYIYLTPPPKLEYVPYDIEKLYWSDMFFNPFKVIKRLFSFARMHVLRGNNQYGKYITMTAEYITSDTSNLYQIKSELDTIVTVIKEYQVSGRNNAPMRNQVEGMKNRLWNNLMVPDEIAEALSNYIDAFLRTFDSENLDKVMKVLKQLINYSAMQFMIANRINPPPMDVLPTDASAEQLMREHTVINPFVPVQSRRTYNWELRRSLPEIAAAGGSLGDFLSSVGKNLVDFTKKSVQKCIAPDVVAQMVRKATINARPKGGCEMCGGMCGGACDYCHGECGGAYGGQPSQPSQPSAPSQPTASVSGWRDYVPSEGTLKKWLPELKGNKSNSLFANLFGYEDKPQDVPLWKRLFGSAYASNSNSRMHPIPKGGEFTFFDVSRAMEGLMPSYRDQVQQWNEREIQSMGKPLIRYQGLDASRGGSAQSDWENAFDGLEMTVPGLDKLIQLGKRADDEYDGVPLKSLRDYKVTADDWSTLDDHLQSDDDEEFRVKNLWRQKYGLRPLKPLAPYIPSNRPAIGIGNDPEEASRLYNVWRKSYGLPASIQRR